MGLALAGWVAPVLVRFPDDEEELFQVAGCAWATAHWKMIKAGLAKYGIAGFNYKDYTMIISGLIREITLNAG